MSDPVLIDEIYPLVGLLAGMIVLWMGFKWFYRGTDRRREKIYDPSGERAARERKERYSLKRLTLLLLICIIGLSAISLSLFKGWMTYKTAEKSAATDTVVAMNIYKTGTDSAQLISLPPDSIHHELITDSIKNNPAIELGREAVQEIPPAPVVTSTPNPSFISYTVKRQLLPNANLKDIFYIRNGTVAFNIIINDKGNVTSNELNNNKSTTSDSTLITYAGNLLRQAKFSAAGKNDSGVIYFKFGNNTE